MREQFVQLMFDVLKIVLPVLGVMLVRYIFSKVDIDKQDKIKSIIENKKDLAMIAVRFVEQVYKDIDGEEKFHHAFEWVASAFEKYGYPVDADEIEGLIEATLRQMKDEFTEQWTRKE